MRNMGLLCASLLFPCYGECSFLTVSGRGVFTVPLKTERAAHALDRVEARSRELQLVSDSHFLQPSENAFLWVISVHKF